MTIEEAEAKIADLEKQVGTLTKERDDARKDAEGGETIKAALAEIKKQKEKAESERDIAKAQTLQKEEIIRTLLNGGGGKTVNKDEFLKSLKL